MQYGYFYIIMSECEYTYFVYFVRNGKINLFTNLYKNASAEQKIPN